MIALSSGAWVPSVIAVLEAPQNAQICGAEHSMFMVHAPRHCVIARVQQAHLLPAALILAPWLLLAARGVEEERYLLVPAERERS